MVATNNQHKLQEIQSILGPRWRILGAQDVASGLSWDETGTSFLENARIKIAALRRHFKGCILADDSGLCVDALQGAPGVVSSSYGGVEGDHARNVARLLADLRDVPESLRGAHFYCLILFSNEKGEEKVFEGKCNGRILESPRGHGGFGYDPVFAPDGYSISMAEMAASDKNAISHRGLAMKAFKEAF